jgi:2,5-dioxopentanoate dehydrogenase
MDTSERNYVDDEWTTASSGELIEVRNLAATTEVVGHAQASTATDAEAAIAAAASLASTLGPECGRILNGAGARLEDRKAEASGTLIAEEGNTYSEASVS